MSTERAPCILECRDLTFRFCNGSPLFVRLNMRIPKGAYALVKGPSGTGKSTLLRLCNRLEEPAQGEILFNGRSIRDYPPPLLRRRMAYVQQTPVVLDASIADNLLLPFGFAQNKDLQPPDAKALQNELERFVPEASLGENALHLSGGQRQRLCLLRALLLRPELLLLDEPTSALDPENRAVVEEIIENLNREQEISVLFVCHTEYAPRNVRTLLTVRVRDKRAVVTESATGAPAWT